MEYKINDGSIVTIDVGYEVKLIPEYQEKFPGFYKVVEALETYLIIDFISGQYGFDPSLILEVKGGLGISEEDLNAQVVTVIKAELPALVKDAVAQSVKEQVTPELIAPLAITVVESEVKEQLAILFQQIVEVLKK